MLFQHDVGRKCLIVYLGLKMFNENVPFKPNMGNQLRAKLRKVVKQPSMLGFRHDAEQRSVYHHLVRFGLEKNYLLTR